jgi:hypothetical protein
MVATPSRLRSCISAFSLAIALGACSAADRESTERGAGSEGYLEGASTPLQVNQDRVRCRRGQDGVLTGDYASGDEFGGVLDLSGVTEITGTLVLSASPAVLATTSCLRRVGGDLIVLRELTDQNPTTLRGLEQLASVGGSVTIDDRSSIVAGSTLEGLSGLRTVGADLNIRHPNLTNLVGLEALRSVGGFFAIEQAVALRDLRALKSLRDVGTLAISGGFGSVLASLRGLENVKIRGGLFLGSLDALASLRGLPELVSLSGDLVIDQVPVLETLNGLERLRTVAGSVTISNAPALRNVNGLRNLEHAANLSIIGTGVASLAPLSGFPGVDGSLFVHGNPSLTSLRGLEDVSAVGEQLLIGGMPITSLAGLEGLRSVGLLSLTLLPDLTSLDGLENLTRIDQILQIQRNASLARIDALSQLRTLGGGGVLECPVLASLHGLEGVQAVSGSMTFQDLPALGSLSGLSGLREVAGALTLWQLPAITSLAGLDALVSVGGLTISANNQLASLDGLGALTNLSGPLAISHNPELPGCEAEALALRLQTVCTCPSWTTPFCVDNCPFFRCGPCEGIGYCTCSGTCGCFGNDNPGVCAP